MIGKTVSHYKILEKLGEGGMGQVFKALDTRLDRYVALKFLPPELSKDQESKARFIHEAKSASALQHHTICTIHEIDETADGVLFIVMDCYEGELLKERIDRGPLGIEDAIRIALEVAQGLLKAHEKELVHRDIKPANILLTTDDTVKILDFGLAKLQGLSKLTRTGSTLGTAPYMSPEQVTGSAVDGRSDIWSLGVVLYEMITGRLPFRGEFEQATAYQIVNAIPEPITGLRSGVPLELERIVGKCLEKNTDERYQTAADLIADLKRLQRTSSRPAPAPAPAAHASSASPATPADVRKKKRRYLAPALLLAALVAAILLARPFLFDEAAVSEPKPIAVIPFVNQTGDSSYDYLQDAIPNLLITSLEQSKYLRVMTWERMHDILKQMGKTDAGRIDKELGFELCRREGIHAIIIGSFVKAGDMFATDVKVLDVSTKELLKTAGARGEGAQSIIESQIDELSREIAKGVGLSDRTVAASSQQIASVTTTSMEAYSAYLRGRDQYEKGYWLEAVPSLERAVRLDSTFATAYLYLGRAYNDRANTRERDKSYKKAEALSANVSEKERLYIEAAYAGTIEKNPQRRFELLQTIAERFPQEKEIHLDLGIYYTARNISNEALDALDRALALDPHYGSALNQTAYVYATKGDYTRALDYLQKYASLNPGEPDPLDSMGDTYFYMGDLGAALAKYREAVSLQPDITSYFKIAYIHGLREDYAGALESLESFLKNVPPSVPLGGVRAWKAFYHYLMGQREQAYRDIDEAQSLWSSIENRYFVARLEILRATFLISEGDIDSGMKLAEQAIPVLFELSPAEKGSFAMSLELYRGIAALEKGQVETAERQARAAESQLPQVTSLYERDHRYILTLFRGTVLLEREKTDSAIAVSKQAIATRPPRLDTVGIAVYNAYFMFTQLRDVLARAYIKEGRTAEAIEEYERLTTFDPAKEDRRLICPEYHYYLAKLYEQTGQKEKAIQKYEKFLDIWKSADADIPELVDAKARLKRLR